MILLIYDDTFNEFYEGLTNFDVTLTFDDTYNKVR
ncbi:hypothetical protein V2J09_008483 [Rumex salicifolius]